MQCNINFCMLLQADMLSVRWLFFPNRTIPLGRKLTLNMHFSCTLPGSCSHSILVSLIYSLHLPSLSFSLIVSHFPFLFLPSLFFLTTLFSFFCPASFPWFSHSILSLFSFFLIFPFFQFCLIPLLSHSPAPRKKMFLVVLQPQSHKKSQTTYLETQPVSPTEPSASHAIL